MADRKPSRRKPPPPAIDLSIDALLELAEAAMRPIAWARRDGTADYAGARARRWANHQAVAARRLVERYADGLAAYGAGDITDEQWERVEHLLEGAALTVAGLLDDFANFVANAAADFINDLLDGD